MENSDKITTEELRRDRALLYLRIFIGAMLLTRVITKSQEYLVLEDEYPRILGIDGGSVVTIAGIVEVLCAVAVITGFWIRYASALMVAVMLSAALLFFPNQTFAQGELNFVYGGVFLFFALSGGGSYAMVNSKFKIQNSKFGSMS
ncbi:MAG: DoxX family protein [Tidjanibacter sp.]|nr:DoxX family protein [Tidjanibacter sp.]